MEWENQEQQQHQENHNQRESVNVNVNNGGVMYVKVMTDEQLETLRKQISVYASICEHLVEMHKNLSAHQDLAGLYSSLLPSIHIMLNLICFLHASSPAHVSSYQDFFA